MSERKTPKAQVVDLDAMRLTELRRFRDRLTEVIIKRENANVVERLLRMRKLKRITFEEALQLVPKRLPKQLQGGVGARFYRLVIRFGPRRWAMKPATPLDLLAIDAHGDLWEVGIAMGMGDDGAFTWRRNARSTSLPWPSRSKNSW